MSRVRSLKPTGQLLAHPMLGMALTSLVGREDELESISDRLATGDQRLVTLAGPGGIGKTRLALEVASRAGPMFPGGIHVILLSEVEDPAALLPAIAGAIGVDASDSDALVESLVAAFGVERRLLLLDNLEHLLDATPVLVPLLLGSPSLTTLATSRAALRLTGEHVIEIGPLAGPDPERLPPLQELQQYPAVRLFADRAGAALAGFELTGRTGPIVARICHQLDGIPLAIELAAAQSSVLTPSAILTRIEAHLPYPFEGPRDAPLNRRTMRGTIDWSYSLIRASEQRVFRAASIFPGSFSAAALEAVTRDDRGNSHASSDILESIALLQSHSLMGRVRFHDGFRFRMLRTIRRFAFDMAHAAGEIDDLRDRHATYCLHLAERIGSGVISPREGDSLGQLEVERPNMLAALDRLRQTGQAGDLLRLVVALSGFWIERGHYREGIEWLRLALEAAPHAPPPLRARGLVALGLMQGFRSGPVAASALFAEGMATLVNEGDARMITIARIWDGGIALRAGNLDDAEAAFKLALQASTGVSPDAMAETLTARVVSNLAIVAHERGDLDGAVRRLYSALETYERYEDSLGAARAHRDLGDVLRDQGDFGRALPHYQRALALMGDSLDLRVVMNAFQGGALALAAWARYETAARLLGAAEGVATELGPFASVPTDSAAWRRTLAILARSIDANTRDRAWDEGRQMSMAQAIDMVLAVRIPASDQQGTPAPVALSAREVEVLRMISDGLTDRDIAARLFLSVRTIEAHVLRIRTRLGVRTRTAAVSVAMARGLLDGPTPD